MGCCEDRMAAFFSKYGEVTSITSKSGTATGDMLQVTLTCQAFGNIPSILMCREKRMLVVVERRRHYYWSCRVSRHMSKARPAKNTRSPLHPTTTTAVIAEKASVGQFNRRICIHSKWRDNFPAYCIRRYCLHWDDESSIIVKEIVPPAEHEKYVNDILPKKNKR